MGRGDRIHSTIAAPHFHPAPQRQRNGRLPHESRRSAEIEPQMKFGRPHSAGTTKSHETKGSESSAGKTNASDAEVLESSKIHWEYGLQCLRLNSMTLGRKNTTISDNMQSRIKYS